jgi:hypothetical protein
MKRILSIDNQVGLARRSAAISGAVSAVICGYIDMSRSGVQWRDIA